MARRQAATPIKGARRRYDDLLLFYSRAREERAAGAQVLVLRDENQALKDTEMKCHLPTQSHNDAPLDFSATSQQIALTSNRSDKARSAGRWRDSQ